MTYSTINRLSQFVIGHRQQSGKSLENIVIRLKSLRISISFPKSTRMDIALLNSRFFEAFQPSKEFWLKWSSLEDWSESFVPLYEWNEMLYIGCTDQPPSWKSPQKVMFVLCETEPLAEYFHKLKTFTSQPAKIPSQAQTPPTPNLPKDMPLHPAQNIPRKIEESDPFAAFSTLVPHRDSSEEESLSLSLEDAEAPLQASDDNVLSEAEGLSYKEADEAKIDKSTSEQSQDESPDLVLFSEEELRASKNNILSPRSDDKNQNLEKNIAQVSLANNKLSPVTDNQFEVSKPNIAAGSFSDKAFAQLKTQYSKCMILKKVGNAVIPWLWDSKFSGPSNSPAPISLGQPSPFRIVAKTQKPYHGYVIPNEFFEKFFDDWNQALIPDHLTISPIILNDEVAAMLLAIGPKDINQKSSLLLAEKTALEISKNLQNHPELLAS